MFFLTHIDVSFPIIVIRESTIGFSQFPIINTREKAYHLEASIGR